MSVLAVRDLHASYGNSRVLQGVEFDVEAGELVALLGRNGSGRTTTLRALMGLVPPSRGSVRLEGTELMGLRPFQIARKRLAYVPEEREVFANLTVEENLRIGVGNGARCATPWTIQQMYDFFPRLQERQNTLAGRLSGGEQQMLTICRSVLGNPKVILIDEPTEGLAPQLVERVMLMIVQLHASGVAVVLVEQKMTFALEVSQRVMVMGHGQIVFVGTPGQLMADSSVRRQWLEVG